MAEIQTGTGRRGHFSDEDWADFARQQGSVDETNRLARHLDTGCRRCAPTLQFWSGVVALAGKEASYRPPDGVVRQARAEFAFRRPEGLLDRVTKKASLVFDSFRQPLAAGVRASGPSPRQVLYKAGHYLIRLRVEASAGSDRLSVVGQILDEGSPSRAVENLAVLVLNGDETVERTLTNHLGEFLLEPDPAESLWLSVGGSDIGSVSVPLPTVGRTDETGRGGARGRAAGSQRKTKARQP